MRMYIVYIYSIYILPTYILVRVQLCDVVVDIQFLEVI